MKRKIMNISLSALLILLLPLVGLTQSDWMVSKHKQNDKNPIAFSPESVKKGKVVFLANCKSCHGDIGKNNGLPLSPKPTDFGLQAFLDKNTDGSIFHKMTDGQATMPTYKSILSKDDRWNIVNYIRSFDANRKETSTAVAKPAKTSSAKQEIGKPYSLEVSVDASTTETTVKFFGTSSEGNKIAVEGAEIFIGIKRYFGDLPIMEAGATTNEEGMITTKYPYDMPSGHDGAAEIIAYPIDKDKYGDITQTASITIKTCHPSHIGEERALWVNRAHFPWWLMITYSSILLIVFGVIFKVILNLIKIKKLSH